MSYVYHVEKKKTNYDETIKYKYTFEFLIKFNVKIVLSFFKGFKESNQ